MQIQIHLKVFKYKYKYKYNDIDPMLTSTRYIVNLMIFGTGHMADHLKCICCMF